MQSTTGRRGFLFRPVSSSGFIPCLLLLILLATAGLAVDSLDANEIIRRSIAALRQDWAANPEFDNFETDAAAHGSKTYDVKMILGSPYQVLVAVNGKPLSPEAKAAENRKLQRTISEREHQSPQQREQRIAHYKAERDRDHLLMQELTRAFLFTLQGEAQVNGHDVYVLKATPLPGYVPPSMRAQVLKGMQGTLWIDKQTYQWVKVEAEVVHPVSIEGFLARVEPGTRFELEKMPVSDDIWLPSHFAMKSHSKVLFLVGHHQHEDETYFNYHPADSIAHATTPSHP